MECHHLKQVAIMMKRDFTLSLMPQKPRLLSLSMNSYQTQMDHSAVTQIIQIVIQATRTLSLILERILMICHKVNGWSSTILREATLILLVGTLKTLLEV